jgi:enamine deaminase RidA (YjgF/YER057c/UK114 family)
LLFVSGSLGFDPATMTMVEGGIEAQTEQALKNLRAVVEDGGSSLGQVIKTTVRIISQSLQQRLSSHCCVSCS